MTDIDGLFLIGKTAFNRRALLCKKKLSGMLSNQIIYVIHFGLLHLKLINLPRLKGFLSLVCRMFVEIIPVCFGYGLDLSSILLGWLLGLFMFILAKDLVLDGVIVLGVFEINS